MSATPFIVTLYGKPGCHLCDEAEKELTALTAVYPHTLHKQDITQDEALHAKYCLTIPVVKIGTAVLYCPIAPDQLERALQQAAKSA